MQKKRHAKSYARENAFKSIYTYGMTHENDDVLQRQEFEKEREDKLANEMAYATIEHIDEIDALIKKNLVRWSMKNINLVNLSILRLAIYEIKYEETPAGIVINEALNMAERYSDKKSKGFIHKVLDNVTK